MSLKLEDVEVNLKEHEFTNEVRIKDEEGDEYVFVGRIYDIDIDNKNRVRAYASLRKSKVEYPTRLLKPNELREKLKKMWEVDTRGSYWGKIIEDGEIDLDYSNSLRRRIMKKQKVGLKNEFFQEIFEPLENQVLELYKDIRI